MPLLPEGWNPCGLEDGSSLSHLAVPFLPQVSGCLALLFVALSSVFLMKKGQKFIVRGGRELLTPDPSVP